MKRFRKLFGLISIVAVALIACAMVSCDMLGEETAGKTKDPSTSTPAAAEPKSARYTAVKDSTAYELIVTQSAANAAKAAFTPMAGDSYVLNIAENGATKTSIGTVKAFSNDTFTLTATINVSVSFDVTISNSGITSITGTITVQGGITITGPGGTTPTQPPAVDTAIDGTWIHSDGGYFTFNNGSFEMGESSGAPSSKGVCTTSGSGMTLTPTHAHGNAFAYSYGTVDSNGNSSSVSGNDFELRWYTKDEIMASSVYASWDNYEKEDLDSMFEPMSLTYSVSGDWLNLKVDRYQLIFFRQKGNMPGSGDTDPALLNGTWVHSEGGHFIFDAGNGSFEIDENNSKQVKGTYAASGSSLTLTYTHLHGAYLEALYKAMNKSGDPYVPFEAKWYTKDEAMAAPAFASLTDSEKTQLNTGLDRVMSPFTYTYAVNDSLLVLSMDGDKVTLFRQ